MKCDVCYGEKTISDLSNGGCKRCPHCKGSGIEPEIISKSVSKREAVQNKDKMCKTIQDVQREYNLNTKEAVTYYHQHIKSLTKSVVSTPTNYR